MDYAKNVRAALDELTRLRAVNAELLEALERIALGYEGREGHELQSFSGTDCAEIALAALARAKGAA